MGQLQQSNNMSWCGDLAMSHPDFMYGPGGHFYNKSNDDGNAAAAAAEPAAQPEPQQKQTSSSSIRSLQLGDLDDLLDDISSPKRSPPPLRHSGATTASSPPA